MIHYVCVLPQISIVVLSPQKEFFGSKKIYSIKNIVFLVTYIWYLSYQLSMRPMPKRLFLTMVNGHDMVNVKIGKLFVFFSIFFYTFLGFLLQTCYNSWFHHLRSFEYIVYCAMNMFQLSITYEIPKFPILKEFQRVQFDISF